MISIFSLGGTCEPALAMDRYLTAKRANSAFDWLVTPYRSLLAVLHDDGEQFGIDFRFVDDTVFSERYRLHYHHEFERTTRDEITFSTRQIAGLRDKLIYKRREMLRIARDTTAIFLRVGVATDVPEDRHGNGALDRYDVGELISTSRRKLGHNDFRVLFIERHWPDRQEFVADAPGLHEVRRRPYQQVPGMGYAGDAEFWAELFQSLDLQPDAVLANATTLNGHI